MDAHLIYGARIAFDERQMFSRTDAPEMGDEEAE